MFLNACYSNFSNKHSVLNSIISMENLIEIRKENLGSVCG